MTIADFIDMGRNPRIFRRPDFLPAAYRRAVVAIGNFDGIHIGHRAVLRQLQDLASDLSAPRLVLTFEPHPRQYFTPQTAPFRLTPLRQKLRIFGDHQIDAVVAWPFNASFASLSASAFIDEILMRRLGIAHAVVGHDFCFGRQRSGTVALLQQAGLQHGFEVTACDPVRFNDAVVSSTTIRGLLQQGNIPAATALLQQAWEIEGHVQRGDARGRDLGFPTANLDLGSYVRPAFGVYAVMARIDGGTDGMWQPAVANLGLRPTVGGTAPRLEVHWLKQGGDFYGKRMRVAFIDYLRPELQFADLTQLSAQIALDVAKAQGILDERVPPAMRSRRFVPPATANFVDFTAISIDH